MHNFRRNAAFLCLIAFVAPSTATAQEFSRAQVDSLVSYAEFLESVQVKQRAQFTAERDSLVTDLSLVEFKLDLAGRDSHWWKSFEFGFFAGMAAMAVAVWGAGQLD